MKRDLRKYAKSTNKRLVIGFIVLVFLVGNGLIYLIYGSRAAVTGLLCIIGGLLPVLLIVGLLYIFDVIVNKANDE